MDGYRVVITGNSGFVSTMVPAGNPGTAVYRAFVVLRDSKSKAGDLEQIEAEGELEIKVERYS